MRSAEDERTREAWVDAVLEGWLASLKIADELLKESMAESGDGEGRFGGRRLAGRRKVEVGEVFAGEEVGEGARLRREVVKAAW